MIDGIPNIKREFDLQKQMRREYKNSIRTEKDLIEFLNSGNDGEIIASVKTFSEKLSGRNHFRNDKCYKDLADLWNVRPEYLKDEDNFRTELDLQNFKRKKKRQRILIFQKYLKTANDIECAPFLICHARVIDFIEMWDDLKQYVQNKGQIESMINWYHSVKNSDTKYRFLQLKFIENLFLPDNVPVSLDYKEFSSINSTQIDEHFLSLITKLLNTIKESKEKTFRGQDGGDMPFFYFEQFMNIDTFTECGVNLYRCGKLIADCQYKDFLNFMEQSKNITSCAFDALVARSEQ